MKTITNLLIATILFVSFTAFGQKQIPVTVNNPTHFIVNPAFKVNLIVEDCFAEGKTVTAEIISPKKYKAKYSLLWELDGGAQGHSKRLECVTGNTVTVHVTQYPSGKRITKSVRTYTNSNLRKNTNFQSVF